MPRPKDPYPLLLNGVKVAHWNSLQAVCWLFKLQYDYLEKNVMEPPEPVGKADSMISHWAKSEVLPSLIFENEHYFKPWDAAKTVLENWQEFESCLHSSLSGLNLEFARRLSRLQSWPVQDEKALKEMPSWSLEEAIGRIWGRKILFDESPRRGQKIGEDEWDWIIDPEIEDLTSIQRPLMYYVKAAVPQELAYDAGVDQDRFTTETLYRWCVRRGIPFPDPTEVPLELLAPNRNLKRLDYSRSNITSGSWRISKENLSLTVYYKEKANATVEFETSNLNGKLMKMLCMSGESPISISDVMNEIYKTEIDKNNVKIMRDRLYSLVKDVRKKLDKFGIDPEVLPSLPHDLRATRFKFRLNIPKLQQRD